MQLTGADQQDVAGFDLEAAAGFGGQDVVGHNALAAFYPVDAPHQGDVHQHAAGDEAAAGLFHGADGGAQAGGYIVGGLAVVGFAVPEEVGQAVDVGDGDAVEDHPDVVGGDGGGAGGDFVAGGPAFAAFHHIVDGRGGHIGGGFPVEGAGEGDAVALLDGGQGGAGFLRGDEVGGAQFVVVTPASPVGEAVEPAQDFLFRRDTGLRHKRFLRLAGVRVDGAWGDSGRGIGGEGDAGAERAGVWGAM